MTAPGVDYMTNWDEFIAIQNGAKASKSVQTSSEQRYTLTPRDLGRFVHIDLLFQAYFEGMLGLFQMNAPTKNDLPYGNASHYGANEDSFGKKRNLVVWCSFSLKFRRNVRTSRDFGLLGRCFRKRGARRMVSEVVRAPSSASRGFGRKSELISNVF